tara:strand:- start:484 stop:1392 length:909 start_codon:yes stop_codon:yes gene_type:complete
MLVISFDNKRSVIGGLGDRIVGLISVKVISKLLNKKFYISWTKENIKKYINYEKYDYELLDIEKNNIKRYNYIDNQRGLRKYLIESTDLFIENISMFSINQEISQYLYKNELYKYKNYYDDIFSEYKKLYTDILIPTTYLMDKIENLTKDRSNIIGIQVRCGDCYMITNKNDKYKHNNNIKDIYDKMINIKKNCDSRYNDYNIFFTTDNIDNFDVVNNVFSPDKVIYYNSLIQHIDRKSIDDDISKVFIDNYILSQKTVDLYITFNSNYGRIAALSCLHDNIYGINSSKLDKKKLLSKKDLY